MNEFEVIDNNVTEAVKKRKELIISFFEGRPQSYIAKQTGVDQTKLNKWVNSSGTLEENELKSLNDYLGTDFK